MDTVNEGRRMLWHGLEDASHVSLLGSFHVFDGPLPEWAIQVFDNADVAVFEADTSKSLPLPTLPRGKSLKSLSLQVGERAWATANRLGLDPTEVNHLYPWAAAMQIGFCVKPDELRWELGFESVLQQRARIQDKATDFLETVEEHYQLLFKEVPLQEQLVGLSNSLDRLYSAPETLRQLLATWRRGDVEAIWPISRYSELEELCPNIVAGMLEKRHELWLSRATELIKRSAAEGERLLLVVGCLHLSGPYSFLSWLKSGGHDFQQG